MSSSTVPFQDRILYGADYNPDQWLEHPEVLEEDIRLMHRAGVTSASIGIFSWAMLEPEPGVFRFEWMDEVMDRFAAEGLKVFLATPSGSMPMWMAHASPEVRRMDAEGKRIPAGGRHNHCPTSPIYRDAVLRINTALVLRYGNHAALALWHIGNEFSGECHCELCQKAFRDWLRNRYGDLDALNEAWWTRFWNHSFTEWTQIPSCDKSIDGLAVDWRRFMNDQHVSFLQHEMQPLRDHSPEIPCTTNFMGTNPSTNYWKWAKELDVISNDCYPLPEDRADSWRKSLSSDFTHSLMRGLARGKPWILMECSPSTVNWSRVNKLKRSGVHLQEVLQAVANGADVIHYFQWRKGLGGFEKFHGAVVDHEGSSYSRVFQECAQVGAILQKLAGVAGQKADPAPVGLVVDWESRWALAASAGPKKIPNGDLVSRSCVENFRALRSAGVEVDVISIEDDFSPYAMLVTPALYMMSTSTARKCREYVREGGHWVATYLTGWVDESNRCWRGGFPGPGLRDFFGLWNEELDCLPDDESLVVKGKGWFDGGGAKVTDLMERVHAEGAEVLARVEGGFHADSPFILGRQQERGRATYIAGRLEEEGLISVYRSLAERQGLACLTLPKGVVCKTRRTDRGTVSFLFNYTRDPVPLDLTEVGDAGMVRLADGKRVSGIVELAPYDCLFGGTVDFPVDSRHVVLTKETSDEEPIPCQAS